MLSALATTALTSSARAEECEIILLDHTGSMCADQATCPKVIDGTDPNWTQLPPWINAIDDSKLWVIFEAGMKPPWGSVEVFVPQR